MWNAGHAEHLIFERILQPRVFPGASFVWGSVWNKTHSKSLCRVYRYISVVFSSDLCLTRPNTRLTLTRWYACYRSIHWRQRQNTTRFAGLCLIRAMLIRHAYSTSQLCCVNGWLYMNNSWCNKSNFFAQLFSMSTSDQARLPAKFKHIIKRWKRNQKGYP